MSQRQIASDSPAHSAVPFKPKTGHLPAIGWVIWAIVSMVAAWRLFLAISIWLQPNVVSMFAPAVIYWRRVDEFLPWLTVAIFMLAKDAAAANLGQVRLGRMLSAVLVPGMLLTALGIGLDACDIAAALATAATRVGLGVLFLLALVLAIREVRSVFASLRGGSQRGLTIIDLWRFAAAQVTLLMAAALAGVALSTPKTRWLDDENIRLLFFFLPAAAALPNVLAYAGVSLWNDLLVAANAPPARPRVRAWLLAFAFLNVGPLLLLAGLTPRVGGALQLILPGAAFLLLGILFYLAGFPASAWRGIGGMAHFAAWCCLAIALLAAMLDVTRTERLGKLWTFYSASWRYLWATAAAFWLIGIGTTAMRLLVSEVRAARWGVALFVVFSLGTVATLADLLLASMQTVEAQLPMVRWVIVGSGIVLVGSVLAGFGLLSLRRR